MVGISQAVELARRRLSLVLRPEPLAHGVDAMRRLGLLRARIAGGPVSRCEESVSRTAYQAENS